MKLTKTITRIVCNYLNAATTVEKYCFDKPNIHGLHSRTWKQNCQKIFINMYLLRFSRFLKVMLSCDDNVGENLFFKVQKRFSVCGFHCSHCHCQTNFLVCYFQIRSYLVNFIDKFKASSFAFVSVFLSFFAWALLVGNFQLK